MFDVIPTNGQTWLVCGGRDFSDAATFDAAMGHLVHLRAMPAVLVHGDAQGADSMAQEWGVRHALIVYAVPADWHAHGRAAGPIRNQAMLDKHKPHFVVAFPGGRGTADMVRRARAANIDVAEIRVRKMAESDATARQAIDG